MKSKARQRISVLATLLCGAAVLSGCGVTGLDLKETLTVVMLGVFEQPTDAEGSAEPRYENFTLTGITATESGVDTDLYKKDPQEYRIIDRAQIIHEASLSDFKEKTITSLAFSFDPTVVAAGADRSETAVTLTSPTISYSSPIVVEKAQNVRLEIHVQWKNTVTEDGGTTTAISSPGFRFVVGDE